MAARGDGTTQAAAGRTGAPDGDEHELAGADHVRAATTTDSQGATTARRRRSPRRRRRTGLAGDGRGRHRAAEPPPSRAAGDSVRWAVIDRRIGILFIVFIAFLGIALARATYLGSVRAGSLEREAATQQVSNVATPAPRGAITDNNGAELALSESADDIVADPYLIKNAVSASAELSSLLGTPQLTELKLLTKAHTGFVYLAHLLPASQAQAIANLHIAGISLVPETRRVYPRGNEAAQVVGSVHSTAPAPTGSSSSTTACFRGRTELRRIVSDAMGQPISIDDIKATVPGKTVALTIDSGLQQEVERVLTEVGAEYSPKGATAIAVDPGHGRDPGAGQLARRRQLERSPGPGDRAELRARLDVQGDHGRRRAPGRGGHAEHGVRHPARAPVRRPADPRRRGPRLRDADRRPDPQVLEQHRRRPDRAEARGQAVRLLGAYVRVRPAHGRRPPGRAERHRSALVAVLGLVDGQPTVRPGRVGDTDADGRGLLGDRQRRHPARAPRRAVGRRQADGGAGGPSDHLPTTASELRDMLRGVLADGGTASGRGDPGYDMAGKTGTANIAIDGHYSDSAYVASFIGMVPDRPPRLVVAVVVNQPNGSIYGGSVAAPAFQQIVGWAVPYLGIPPR